MYIYETAPSKNHTRLVGVHNTDELQSRMRCYKVHIKHKAGLGKAELAAVIRLLDKFNHLFRPLFQLPELWKIHWACQKKKSTSFWNTPWPHKNMIHVCDVFLCEMYFELQHIRENWLWVGIPNSFVFKHDLSSKHHAQTLKSTYNMGFVCNKHIEYIFTICNWIYQTFCLWM